MLAGVVAHAFIPALVGQFKDSLRYAASKTLSLKKWTNNIKIKTMAGIQLGGGALAYHENGSGFYA